MVVVSVNNDDGSSLPKDKSTHTFASWKTHNVAEKIAQELAIIRGMLKNPPAPGVEIEKSYLAPPSASLTFKNVGFSVPLPTKSGAASDDMTTTKTILEPCSGHLEPGQLVALMGPSGSGKTTLLDMLAHKKTPSPLQTGTILVNGHKVDKLFPRISAYVGQQDVMPKYWTVREAVKFNLNLKQRRPKNVPKEMHEQQVEVALETFGLSGVANTYIGGDGVRGISGGQRRRVTLARGVVSRASVLFLDEPTSGLSATDAEACIRALQVVAKRLGCLIVVVIHQPRVEVVNLFDRLLLLTSDPGRMVYQGSMETAMQYWASVGYPVPRHQNPVDHYMDLVTPDIAPDTVRVLIAAYKERLHDKIQAEVDYRMKIEGQTAKDMIHSMDATQERAHMAPRSIRERRRALPFYGQLKELLKRDVTLLLRDPAGIQIPIIVPIVQAVLVGLMFQDIDKKSFEDQMPFIFLMTTLLCLTGLQQMPSLIDKRTIMKHDSSEALYSEQAWLFSAFSTSLPVTYLGTLLNLIITFAFSGLEWASFGIILFWCSLLFFFYDSLYSFLASFSPNAEQANVMAVPFQLLFIMFSGFMVRQNSAPAYLKWIFPLSPNLYAMQAIVCEMAGDDPTRLAVVDHFGFKTGKESQGIIVTLAMTAVLRVLQVVALRFTNRLKN